MLRVDFAFIWFCLITVNFTYLERKERGKKTPALNLIHRQSHHSQGQIWIRCLDAEFAKGLACYFEGLTAAPYPLSKWWSPRGFLWIPAQLWTETEKRKNKHPCRNQHVMRWHWHCFTINKNSTQHFPRFKASVNINEAILSTGRW